MSTETEFLTAYEQIKSAYGRTMTKIDNAISLEERKQRKDAIEAYEICVKDIEKIFAISVGLPENIEIVATQWADACRKIQTLKNVKTEIIYRLKVLHSKQSPIVSETEEMDNNSNSEIIRQTLRNEGETPSEPLDTFKKILDGLREIIATKNSNVLFETLFCAESKLYKIKANGEVATMEGATHMSLVMCTIGGRWQYLNGIYFLQFTVSSTVFNESSNGQNDMIWLYPLIPNITKGYRTDYNAIILPDLESESVGDAFGIMVVQIPATTATTIEIPTTSAQAAAVEAEIINDQRKFFLDLLEAVLSGRLEQIDDFHVQGPQDNLYDTSYKISKGLVTTADFIAKNLIKGAQKTGELMVNATPYITSKLEPGEENAPVSKAVKKTAEVASSATYVAAGVTGWVANKIGSASMAIGQYLAPHVHRQGVSLLEKAGYDNTQANNKMEGAFRIAAGAVDGFSTVKNGLETSAAILGKNLGENSVKIIKYKYGTAAGGVANNTFDTIGNCFVVSRNVNYITPKGLAKSVAKKSGTAIVDDYRRTLHEDKNLIQAGNLYPDLRTINS